MRLGIIGCGNMASAILAGILREGLVAPTDVLAADPNEAARDRLKTTHGVATTADNGEAAAHADVLILAVKPNCVEAVAREIDGALSENTILVTLAAGKTLAWTAGLFSHPVKLVRLMPNTPALVGEGMTGYCKNENVTDREIATVAELLSSFSLAEEVPEALMDAVTGVSGSAPAYGFLFIDAIAEAGTKAGLPKEQALRFAAQAIRGSAKMVLETGRSPQELTEMVCSPGGTTIEAVEVFQKRGLAGMVDEAVQACVAKAKTL